MVDFKKSTGSSGQMMIRDTGTTVEFWITANNSTTFAHSMPWGSTVNGVTNNSRTYRYEAGSYWERIGSWTVSTAQTVTFRLFDTGTSGLGGPTTLSASISRGSAPPKPPSWQIEQIEAFRVQGDVDGYGNGGLSVDQIQVRYSKFSDASSPLYQSEYSENPGFDGWMWIEGLDKGTTYYFWVRTHNAKGWSPWSDRTSAKTDSEPSPPSAPVILTTTMTSAVLSITDGASNGEPIVERELGYGVSSAAPQMFQTFPTGSTSITVVGLNSGYRYYFWARTRNAAGWSTWSSRTDNQLIAGAWFFFRDAAGNVVPKRAVPYVKVDGIWRPAKPMVKIAGMWKGTA